MKQLLAVPVLLAAVAIPSVLVATQGQQATEARIQAQKHDDGRIEFALQVREGDGWSERILPRGRTLRSSSPTGRWLSSTPVELSGSIVLPITTASTYRLEQDAYGNSLMFYARRMQGNGLSRHITEVEAEGVIDNSVIETPKLILRCASEEYSYTRPYVRGFQAFVSVDWRKHDDSTGLFIAERFKEDELGRIVYNSEGNKILEEELRWVPTPGGYLGERDWDIPQAQMLRIKGFHVLYLFFHGWDGEVVVAAFDIAQALGTPVQTNLDHCGSYEHGEEIYQPVYQPGH
ncbi:MAG: hypothetical protein OXH13_08150 [Chloroflexi bacterium]|nr:hypothetical protein [Chloroflexota bacterium]MCY3696814.1 hypothetical protein [Chloroflexota bacterium]